MKKILTGLALTATLATSAIANAGAKHSIVAGLGVGMQNFHMNTYLQTRGAFDGYYATSEAKVGATAFLGYRAMMGMFLGGLDVDVTTPATYLNKQTEDPTDDFTAQKINAKWAFGVSALLGANITDNAYLALRLGGEYREHAIKFRWGGARAAQLLSEGDKIKKFAFVPGLVLGTTFAGCWDLSLDYRLRLGGSKKRTDTVGVNTTDWKFKERTHTVMLKLGYRFGL